MRRLSLHLISALTLALAACGGGDPAPTHDADALTGEPDGADDSDSEDTGAVGEPDVASTPTDTPTEPGDPDVPTPDPDVPAPDPDVAPDAVVPPQADAIEEVAKPNEPPVAVDDHSATFAGEVC